MSPEWLHFSHKERNIVCQTEEVQIVKMLLKSAFHPKHYVSPNSTTHKGSAFCKKNSFVSSSQLIKTGTLGLQDGSATISFWRVWKPRASLCGQLGMRLKNHLSYLNSTLKGNPGTFFKVREVAYIGYCLHCFENFMCLSPTRCLLS